MIDLAEQHLAADELNALLTAQVIASEGDCFSWLLVAAGRCWWLPVASGRFWSLLASRITPVHIPPARRLRALSSTRCRCDSTEVRTGAAPPHLTAPKPRPALQTWRCRRKLTSPTISHDLPRPRQAPPSPTRAPSACARPSAACSAPASSLSTPETRLASSPASSQSTPPSPTASTTCMMTSHDLPRPPRSPTTPTISHDPHELPRSPSISNDLLESPTTSQVRVPHSRSAGGDARGPARAHWPRPPRGARAPRAGEIASDGFGWLLMASDGLGWPRMAPEGFRGLQRASDGFVWPRMALDGLGWLRKASEGF